MPPFQWFGTIKHIPVLIKFKLSSWVTLTSYSGYYLSPEWDLKSAVALGFGVFFCSASSHAANQLIEFKSDLIMNRTCNRPIVTGKISKKQAVLASLTFASAGVTTLAYFSPISAMLGLANILAYTLIYTPLKYKTKYNTHIGAIVGAVPPLIGSAISNVQLNEISPWILFSTLYCWQMPHFYLIAWLNRNDCLKAGFRMVGITDNSGKTTGRASVKWHSLATLLSSSLFAINFTNSTALIGCASFLPLMINLFLMKPFILFMKTPTNLAAIKLFKYSLWHILALLASNSYVLDKASHNLPKP